MALATVLCLALARAPAAGHEMQALMAEITLEADGRVAVEVIIDAAQWAPVAGGGGVPAGPGGARGDGSGPDRPGQSAPTDQRRALTEALAEAGPRLATAIALGTDAGAVALAFDGAHVAPAGADPLALAVFRFSGRLPAGATALEWALPTGYGDSSVRVRRSGQAGLIAAAYVVAGQTSPALVIAEAGSKQARPVVETYLVAGFQHIIPKGPDHILFVIGLLLLSARVGPVLWQIILFTIAHSLALALGASDLVRINPQVTGLLIALSVLYVAIDNLRGERLGRWRLALVFGSGLLHGLGLAGDLTDYGLPEGQFATALIAFNMGIEAGQLAVLALCFLSIGIWVADRSWYRRVIVVPASLAIAGVAVFWVVQRTGVLA